MTHELRTLSMAKASNCSPSWTVPLFRYTAKVSRQVLRFIKFCFLKPASPALYERQLEPMLRAYL